MAVILSMSRKEVENLNGKKFDYLTVVGREPDLRYPNKRYKDGFMKISMWRCVCKCNPNVILVVRGTSLTTGHTRSCGCFNRERAAQYCKENKKKYNLYALSGEYGVGWTSNTNREFYFDLNDYDKIKEYCWRENDQGYIVSYTKARNYIKLHRLVMGFPESLIDHINGERHDNRKSQLRMVNHTQNGCNHKLFKNNKSGHTGVHWHKRDKMWYAYIRAEGKQIHLGRFEEKEDAIKARHEAELKYFGEFNRDKKYLK